jgi:hypothetical protein
MTDNVRIHSGSDFISSTEEQSDGSHAQRTRLLSAVARVTATLTRPLNTTPAYTANQVISSSTAAGSALIRFIGVGPINSLVELVEFQCISSDEASQQQIRMFWFNAGNGIVSNATSVKDKDPAFIEDGDADYNDGDFYMPPFSRLDASAHTGGASISRDYFYKYMKTDVNGDVWGWPVNMTASYTPLSAGVYKFLGFWRRV